LTYSSTLLPQTNDPAEIQKSILDLLGKINEVGSSSSFGEEQNVTFSGSVASYTAPSKVLGGLIKLSPGIYHLGYSGEVLYTDIGATSHIIIYAGLSLSPGGFTTNTMASTITSIHPAGTIITSFGGTVSKYFRVEVQSETIYYFLLASPYSGGELDYNDIILSAIRLG
jgi:hypothetical protein